MEGDFNSGIFIQMKWWNATYEMQLLQLMQQATWLAVNEFHYLHST